MIVNREHATYRPSEGEVELQGDGFGEGEGVGAEGVTRYVAEATGADGSDIRLVLLEAEPEGRRAGRRARRVRCLAAPASPAATPAVHQGAPVVRQREDLHLEVSARGCRLQAHRKRDRRYLNSLALRSAQSRDGKLSFFFF